MNQSLLLSLPEFIGAKDYWEGKLHGEVSGATLPHDFTRIGYERKEYKISFDDFFLTYKLLENKSGDLALYVVLLCALKITLSKYTGQNDIIIGSPVYLNDEGSYKYNDGVALRTVFDDKMTLSELLTSVKQTVADGYKNQHYPFSDIVRLLDRGDDAHLFRTILVLENIHQPKHLAGILNQFKNDFTLSFLRTETGVDGYIIYNSQLYSTETIHRFNVHFINILRQLFQGGGKRLAEIEMIPENEKKKIINEFNNTTVEYPRDKIIIAIFNERVKSMPDKTAVIFGSQSLTYQDLNKKANQLANFLNTEQGVQPDSLVGILMERSIELIEGILGILKAGGAYVPIDPKYPEERTKTIINDAGLTTIISVKKYLKLLNKLQWECNTFNTFVCMDSNDIYSENETQKNELMDEHLWNYVGDTAKDEIAGGGWVSSYTGQDFSKQEMAEYAENIFVKLKPYLNERTRILEIGCASGISMFKIAPHVGFYYGIDLSNTIMEKNKQRIVQEGIKNIKLKCLPAHEIEKLDERDFDIIIMNSIVHCFHGHNYLRNVIIAVRNLLKEKGIIFIGDIPDQELKTEFVQSLNEFKQKDLNHNYQTKTDFSAELFVSRNFFTDLKVDVTGIKEIHDSTKIFSIENELTKYRYDILLEVDKTEKCNRNQVKKHKHQHDIRSLEKYNGDFTSPEIKPHNLAYVIYTSGSTGRPKGVMIEHYSVINRLNWMQKKYPIDGNDTILQKTPITFDVSIWELFWWIFNGAKVCFLVPEGEKDPQKIVAAIEKYMITTIHFVPSMLNSFLEYIEARKCSEQVKNLRQVFASGEALDKSLVRKFNQILNQPYNIKLHNLYGPTEATVDVSYFDCADSEKYSTVPIGKPIDNIKLYVLNYNYVPQPIDVVGELCIGGDGLARGYINRPELTAEKFVPNPFIPGERLYKTGDLARWLLDGNIEFLGRMDNQVKIRGNRIELGEIESQLLRNEMIREAVVITKEDNNGDKQLYAYYTSDREFDVSDLREYLQTSLPEYMIPSSFIQLDKLPYMPNGKIDRKVLPSIEGRIKTSTEYIAPGTQTEQVLVKIWQAILGIEQIGVNDNFFELGGHSLKATLLVSRIHKELNVELPLNEIFINPTIHQLAKTIEESREKVYQSIKTVEKKAYYPLSSAQKRLFLVEHLENMGTSYNLSAAFIITGELNEKFLKEAVNQLIQRHEIMRTSFEIINGEPVQKVHNQINFEIGNKIAEDKVQLNAIAKDFLRPFNLGQPPLFRFELVRWENKQLLLFDIHHIITDGISLNIIADEFSRLYSGVKLDPVDIQYKDFAVWQNAIFKTNYIKKQEEYWLNRFSNDIPILNMPTDYPRPVIPSFEGDKLRFHLTEELSQQIRNKGLETGSTLYMILLAAFNILLYKYTGQEDIIVGSPAAGRPHADLERMLGMFVNTIPMRNFPSGKKTIKEFIDEIKINALDAYRNQDYQFEELVEKLKLKRELGRNPLFDVMFVVENMDLASLETNNLKFDFFEIVNQDAKFDFILYSFERGKQLYFEIEYRTSLFRKETINRLADHYINILKEITRNFEQKIREVNILTQSERQEIIFGFNNTQIEYPVRNTISQLFEEQVQRTPDNIAIRFNNLTMTYKVLNEKANQLARFLKKRGVDTGTVVGIMMERSPEMVISLMAILKAGGAYLPIDPDLPEDRVFYMLENAKAKVLISNSNEMKEFAFTRLQNFEMNTDLEIAVTSPREHIREFDRLPAPDRTLIDLTKYQDKIGMASVNNCITIQTTRGCPYQCLYCHKIWSKHHVHRTAENILNEIEHYYKNGVTNFAVIDDCFNLDIRNSSRLFKLIIANKLKVQLFFPNGLRGDILIPDYIDLMVEAGTRGINLSLETASPRLQKLLMKNLDLDRFKTTVDYIGTKHADIILEMATMHGFPTETEEEAMMTLNFIKDIKWIHFPYIHILKIFPNTEMEAFALANGISKESILISKDRAFHELPETLPFAKSFTRKYQAEFLNEYFLAKERLKQVLPVQMGILDETALIQKYNAYLPVEIKSIQDIIKFAEIDDWTPPVVYPDKSKETPVFFKTKPPVRVSKPDAKRILLLDLSQHFSSHSMLYKVMEQPLGLLYLLTHLNQQFGNRIEGRIYKSGIDFDSFDELRNLVTDFKPDLIGIRTLTFFKEFFHETVSLIRKWGIGAPVIVGGPYASSDYDTILKDNNVDLVVLGEGEYTFSELLEKMFENNFAIPPSDVLKTIRGIVFPLNRGKNSKHIREVIIIDQVARNIQAEEKFDLEGSCNYKDLAYVMYTSGTTGKPKGIMVEHRQVNNCIFWMQDYYPINPADVILQRTNLTFDPSVWEIFWPLYYGASIQLITSEQSKDAEFLITLLTSYHPLTVMYCPASLITAMTYLMEVKPPSRKLKLPKLFIGAESIYRDTVNKFYTHFEGQIINTYGPTECTINNTYYVIDKNDPYPFVPIGKPVANNQIYITSRDLELLPVKISGEICIAGDSVSRGYIHDNEKTAINFVDNPFGEGKLYRTGDMGRWLEDGNIEILGRVDEQVKIRGYRIELGEIKSALLSHPDINDCAVVVRNTRRNKTVKACKRCGLTTTYPDTVLNEDSICETCLNLNFYQKAFNDYFRTLDDLDQLIKKTNQTKTGKYDCLLLYSGGKGAAYALYHLIEMGYKVLAATYDNGYFSKSAMDKIKSITGKLGVDHVFLKHPNTDQILGESLKKVGTVCRGCFQVSSALGLDYAYQNNIKIMIGATLSRGQIIENKLFMFYKQGITDVAEIEKGLANIQQNASNIDGEVYDLIGIKTVKDGSIYNKVTAEDFYRYCEVTNQEIIEYLNCRDEYWKTKHSAAIYSTNCPIKHVGDFYHLKTRGYHYYGSATSWEKRLGHITLQNISEDLYCKVTQSGFDSFTKRIHFAREKSERMNTEYICAYLVANKNVDLPELRLSLQNTLPNYMIPSYFVLLDKIPLTSNGKLDEAALPESDKNMDLGNEYLEPATEVEMKLAAVWKEVLGVERVGVNDNFFELGGHSLKATILMAQVNKELEVEVPLRKLFKTPTIKDLALYIENSSKNTYLTISPAFKQNFYPVTSAQKRLYFLQQMEGIGSTYNIPIALAIEGELDIIRFEEAIHQLIQRHEAFRTSFHMVGGKILQKVNPGVNFTLSREKAEENEVDAIIANYNHPFNLNEAPLLRVKLIHISDQKSILILVMHHIVSDGFSLSVLVKDLIDLYNGKGLPELKIQYKDYAVWLNNQYSSEWMKKQESFWLNCFMDKIPVLDLPTDYPRSSYQSFAGNRLSFSFDPALTGALKNLSLEAGSTLYMTLLAIFNVMLAKYSNQHDIVVGSPIAGRPNADLNNLIGLFINTLPMRNFPEGRKTFWEFLVQVKENSLKAYENQDYPYAELLDNLKIQRQPGRNPLFDVSFVLLNVGLTEVKMTGNLSVKSYPVENKTAKHDLVLEAIEQDNTVSFTLEYCSDLYQRKTVERMAENFITIAQKVIENPKIIISEIGTLSEEKKKALIADFND